MKLRLPTALCAALAAVATAALPLATTVAGAGYFSAAAMAATPPSTELVFTDGTCNLTGSPIYTETLTIDGTKTIYFAGNNRNLGIGALTLNADSELVLKADRCDLAVINDIAGSGTLTINQNNNGMTWGYHVALYDNGAGGTSTDFTGVINLMKGDNPSNSTHSTVLFLMDENAANGATIDIGKYTTLAVSATTAKVAGLTGSDANGAVISYGNTNNAKSIATIDLTSENCYNYEHNINTNDETARTLELTGSGTYAYAGAVGSATNATSLDLTKSGSGTQTLSGTVYLNDLTVSGGALTLSGTTTLAGASSVGTNGTLTLNGTISVASAIDNSAGVVIIDSGAFVQKTVGNGASLDYAGTSSTTYQGIDISALVTDTSAEHLQGSLGAVAFTSVIFENGGKLVLSNGQKLSETPTIASNDASITLEVAENATATYGVQIESGNGISQVNVGTGATLNITTSKATRHCVFNRQSGATLGISLASGATLDSTVTIFGWDNTSSAYNGRRTLEMGTGSKWNITGTEYMNNTTIVMSGATINIKADSNLWFERHDNYVKTAADATKMSVISGDGKIQFGNNGNNGVEFNIVRSTGFEIDSTNTADLRVSALCTNIKKKLFKKGTGVLELTNSGNDFSSGVDVEAGTLKLGDTGGKAGTGTITVATGATLELAHSAACTTANAIAMSGNLVVSGSGVETISGAISGTAQSLKVGTNGGLVLSGNTLQVANYAKTGTVVLNNNAILQINAVASNTQADDIYSPVSGGDGTGRLIIDLGTNSTWQTSNIVSLEAGTDLKDVTVVGHIALSQFGGSGLGFVSNQTNLQGNDLRMTDGAQLVIRSANGGDGNMGKILLEGTATIDAYGSFTTTLANNIRAVDGTTATTKLVKADSGTVTLTGTVTLDTISVTKGTLNIGGTLALTDAISNSGTLNVLSGATMDLSNWKHIWQGANICYNIGAGVSFADTGVKWTVDNGTYDSTTGYYTVVGTNLVFTATAEQPDFTWGTSKYDGEIQSTLTDDGTVVFAGNANVILADTTSVGTMVVTDGASVTFKPNGHTLTAQEMYLGGDLILTANDKLSVTNWTGEGQVKLDWSGKKDNCDAINNYTGVIVITEGTGLRFMNGGRTLEKVVVEDGGFFAISNNSTVDGVNHHIGDIYISGNGLQGDDTTGALKFGQGRHMKGDVHIVGGSAGISAWNGEYGHIDGDIIGDTANSTLNLVNAHISSGGGTGQQLEVVNIRGVEKVNITDSGVLTVTGNIVNADGGFIKTGNGTLVVNVGAFQLKSGSVVDLQEGVIRIDNTSGSNGYTQAMTGTGTLKIAMPGTHVDAGATTNHFGVEETKIDLGNDFAGVVEVTQGHMTTNKSNIGSGTWQLDDSVDVQVASTKNIGNKVVLVGTNHNIYVNSGSTGTFSEEISGGTFAKCGAGTMDITGTLALESGITVQDGTLKISGTIDLTQWAFAKTKDEDTGVNSYAYTIISSGSATLADTVTWSIGGGEYANGVYTWTTTADHVVTAKSFAWGSDSYLAGETSTGATDNVLFLGTTTVTMAGNVASENSTIAAGAEVSIAGSANTVTFTNLTNEGTLVLKRTGAVSSGTTFAEGKQGTLAIAWGNRNEEMNAFVNGFTGDVVVKAGSGLLSNAWNETKADITYKSLVVEDGAQYAVDGTLTVDEGNGTVTISGSGISGSTSAETSSALKIGGSQSGSDTRIKANVLIDGDSAVISSWNTQGGTVEGNIGGNTAGTSLSFVNSNGSGNNILNVTEGINNISSVSVQCGTMTVDEAATNAGETFTKSGAGTLALESISSGESGAAGNVSVAAGTLKLTGETAVAAGKTVTLGTAATMTAVSSASLKSLSLESNGNISSASSETLGEMTSVALEFAAATTISNVTMTDSVLSGGTVSLSNVTAIAATAESAGIAMIDGEGEQVAQSLNATPVVVASAVDGTLKVDIDSGLLSPENYGKNLVWNILQDVTIGAGGFTLELGDVLKTLIQNGLPEVTLYADGVMDAKVLTVADLGNLKTAAGGLLEGFSGGNLTLAITNIPEPATATLSLLALAALAARRRRK